MRKKVFGKKLGRNTNTRKALFRALAREMISRGSIKTTKAKAKALQPTLEKMASFAKKGGINSKRKVISMMGNDKKSANTLFSPKFNSLLVSRNSGFTRIVTLPARRGDNTQLARLEWVVELLEPAPAKEEDKKSKSKKEAKSKK